MACAGEGAWLPLLQAVAIRLMAAAAASAAYRLADQGTVTPPFLPASGRRDEPLVYTDARNVP